MLDILFGVFYFILLYLTVFLMITLVVEGDSRGKPKKMKEWPLVSVIIPAFNESATINRVVKSVLNLDYPKEKLEVIVVDDGSTDNTSKIVEKTYGSAVRVLKQQRKGKAAALNLGLDHAEGNFVACLDADSYVSQSSLKHMIANFSSADIAAITPIMRVYNPKTFLEKIQQVEYLLAVYMKKLLSHINSINVTPGPFSIYRADVLNRIGRFDENSLVEDQEIAYRIQKNNYRIVQSDRGDVYTAAPKTLRDLYLQRKRWCKGSWLTFKKYSPIMLDKTYGDFGFYLMPNVLFGLISCFFMLVFFSAYVMSPVLESVRHIYMAGLYINPGYYLNMGEIVSNFVFFTDFYRLFVLWTFATMTIFMVLRSHKVMSEKIGLVETIPIAAFLFFYYIFISFVNLLSTADLLVNKRHRW
ncbi:MAG: glycosyltransferase family 2 protein [Candidatus Aenigmarchaeota archaeon]|nr:glycosyltransferase family 2 protein [Candidatus Aenigmarchaeota archaeon]